jgi:hypothetical protein
MMGNSTAVQRWLTRPLLCGALGLSACTAARPPVSSVSYTEVIVRQPSLYPPVELQLAREELDNARLALDTREYERARRLADQAAADAQLAEVRAESENSRRSARDVRLSSEALHDEAVGSGIQVMLVSKR